LPRRAAVIKANAESKFSPKPKAKTEFGEQAMHMIAEERQQIEDKIIRLRK